MAKTSPKRDAVITQVEELRKSGLKDADIRKSLKRFGLSEAQLNDVLPNTMPPKEEPVKVEPVDEAKRKQVISECASFMRGMPQRMTEPDAQVGPLITDLLVWAKKLEGVL